MNVSPVVILSAALVACVVASSTVEAEVPYRPAQSSDRERAADRDAKAKERTPPPRPIVPPEGQQQSPALREDCAWLGQRIVSLLFRDDAMTASDFVPFYARFGCPEEHLGRSFACVVINSGTAENDALADRIAQCWTDPARRETPAAAASDSSGSVPATPDGKPTAAGGEESKPGREPADKPAEANPKASGNGKTGGDPVSKPAENGQKPTEPGTR